ncbi:MAG: AraC family transcriptional regulator [Alphaproteobacteria bacterium]|nr:AraC family transcriptional regulator [Alphaproteobacteria bacterium]
MLAATRAPAHPALHGVVDLLWLAPGRGGGARERVIPAGGSHLVWRLGAELRIGEDQRERAGVLGGPRSSAHLHHTSDTWSIGVMLAPGAIPRLFGTSARSLSERHVGLPDLWGLGARGLQERLEERPDRALDLVEAQLVATLRPARTPPELARALASLEAGMSVEAAARRIGRGTRTLGLWFADEIGLSPSRWASVRRVRRAMALAANERDGARVAVLAGYADHAHLCRDFRAVTGVTMTEWRRHVPGEPSHVPVPIHSSG